LAEISPSAVETIMSIFQKEFFGDNVYFSTIKSERVQNKDCLHQLHNGLKTLGYEEGYGTPRTLRKHSATCKYLSIPNVWLLAIWLISIR